MTRILTIIALLFATPAWAGMPKNPTAKEVIEAHKNKETWAVPYLEGMMSSLLWSNDQQMYCPPSLMIQNAATALSAIQYATGTDTELESFPAAAALVSGLKAAYSCEVTK